MPKHQKISTTKRKTQETHHLHWTSNFLFSPYFFVNACVLFSPHQEPKNHRCLFRTIWRFPVAAAVGSPTSRRQVSLRRCGRWCGRRCPGDPPGALGGKAFVVGLREKLMMEVAVFFCIFGWFGKVDVCCCWYECCAILVGGRLLWKRYMLLFEICVYAFFGGIGCWRTGRREVKQKGEVLSGSWIRGSFVLGRFQFFN